MLVEMPPEMATMWTEQMEPAFNGFMPKCAGKTYGLSRSGRSVSRSNKVRRLIFDTAQPTARTVEVEGGHAPAHIDDLRDHITTKKARTTMTDTPTAEQQHTRRTSCGLA
jgi:hypothetical protein